MEYEIHVTVKTPYVVSFINDCHTIGVKPIVIETEKEEVFDHQVMTSSKHKDDNDDQYFLTLASIANQLKDKGYQIIREKVEIRPLPIKNNCHIYYESHFRLKLLKDFDRSTLKVLCKDCSFHLSKNLFKKAIDFDYQMITYRNYNQSFDQFNQVIFDMKERLTELNISFDKVEIEECIHDSNIKVDSNWI